MDDRISKIVAIKVKEKGIFIDSNKMYREDNTTLLSVKMDMYGNPNNYEGYYAAPLQSQLQKLLREKYDIHFVIKPFKDSLNNIITYVADPINLTTGRTAKIKACPTYEKALDEGLLQALTLITNE